ncbi:DUF6545 domain-containing protein [Mycobacterium sp. 852002-50816_SCH5313054-b]|uniref:DUF6545 domain-containing protein n=1 Tax=Mycobacterium sp. 852002-50816_SCH5313054-b TaxID=1834092 RepID=UPI0012E9D623|nr:DUF6545 domain-containing protein [Mycobacterium sp. 852002-50816_SCH5313054-b]
MTTALIFAAICCLLRERTVQAAIINLSSAKISPPLLYHLSELAVIPSAAALFLLGYTWINDVEPPYLAPLVYSAAAVCTLSTFALWWSARAHNIPFTVHSGWAVIAYSSSLPAALAAVACHDSLVYWFAVMLLIICFRELRQRPDRRAVAICLGVGTVATGVLMQTAIISVATITAATGRHNTFINTVGVVDRFSIVVWTYIGSAVAAIPLFSRILQIAHLDKYSRRRKHLMPLWRDLTTACPEIVYLRRGHGPVVRTPSRYRLHRTVVEIRDCILILSRYAVRHDQTIVDEIAAPPTLRQAVRLALAWSAKSRGEPPSEDFAAQQSAAMELVEETDELSQLAEYWHAAKVLATKVAPSRDRENSIA